MSVISPPLRASRLWPLWLMAGVLLSSALLVWLYWSQILMQSVLWQKDLHRQM
ncbi:MAG TPA: nickel transporter, partial [Pantoea agglomerans]|nr:nickel transporter [Pantoea agglomerans]